MWQAGTKNATIANNIFFDNGSDENGSNAGSVFALTDGGGHLLRNNVYSTPELAATLADFTEENNVAADPGFASAATGDYHLTQGSPAVGAGAPGNTPLRDLENRWRDRDRADAGALHYCP